MTETIPNFEQARAGDWLESPVAGGGPPRRGLILEVRGGPGHRRFLVRWDEEHEAIHYPEPHERLRRESASSA